MRLRRWVVYEFDAAPPPYDGVRDVGRFFTFRGAVRHRVGLGVTIKQWMRMMACTGKAPKVYYGVHKLPKKRTLRIFRHNEDVLFPR